MDEQADAMDVVVSDGNINVDDFDLEGVDEVAEAAFCSCGASDDNPF